MAAHRRQSSQLPPETEEHGEDKVPEAKKNSKTATEKISKTPSDQVFISGAPGGTRTPNRFLRTELLFH